MELAALLSDFHQRNRHFKFRVLLADMYVSRPIVYIAGAILGVQAAILALVLLFLLLVAIGNALVGTYDETPEVTYHNTTPTPICLYSPRCGSGIPPNDKVTRIMDSCFGMGSIELYANGRIIYGKVAECRFWDGASVVINERDGEFIVADTIPSSP